ncbi:GNAT family N-acetyltransferase [Paenibacillus allorhizosphaerae]|uniref:N-acetyltransferase domain-containing protein n=1 Tax=Paenibacillus allorhizosphaerae TaxID=2849866 RepID=A0ABM8VD31_9BACL|nr:GNAT family N-acetyltransferase [Paenibacillus allorhizosphaerae]CAG7626269.1 putative protein YqjY [Paenibacillus allorhizosphaerae]
MITRTVRASDYPEVIAVINAWWGGRNMADMLPKLFFVHFQNTSFIVEEKGQILAFLIGFVSQTNTNEGYIHFVGVHPDHRKKGMAKCLYETFFGKIKPLGCNTVRCVTSPVNKNSIMFHTNLGFQVEQGDSEVEGISVHTNYDGKGESRVLFVKKV